MNDPKEILNEQINRRFVNQKYIIEKVDAALGKQIEMVFKKYSKSKFKSAAGFLPATFKHDKEYGVVELHTNGATAKKLGQELEKKFGKKINVYVRDMYVPKGDDWEVAVEY